MIILLAFLVLVLCGAIYKHQTGARLRRALRRTFEPHLCRFRPHRRALQTVRLEGNVYRSRCKRCGAAIERIGKDGVWQAIDEPDDEPDARERAASRRRERVPTPAWPVSAALAALDPAPPAEAINGNAETN